MLGLKLIHISKGGPQEVRRTLFVISDYIAISCTNLAMDLLTFDKWR